MTSSGATIVISALTVSIAAKLGHAAAISIGDPEKVDAAKEAEQERLAREIKPRDALA